MAKRPYEKFIEKAKKGLPSDRLIRGSDGYLELAQDIIKLADELKTHNRLIETLTDVVEDQHQIILGYMEAEKQRGLDSGKVYAEHSKGARKWIRSGGSEHGLPELFYA